MAQEQNIPEQNQPKTEAGSLDFLEQQLHFTGFNLTDEQKQELADKLAEDRDFTLQQHHSYSESNGDRTLVDYELAFRKSQSNDKIYFNAYTATGIHQTAIDPEKIEGEQPEYEKEFVQDSVRSQKFAVNSNGKYNITAKQAFNLLSGRAVNTYLPDRQFSEDKDGKVSEVTVPKNAWIKLDFETPKNRYGNFQTVSMGDLQHFHPAVALSKYLTNTEERLAKPEEETKISVALKRGDRVFVDLISKNGKDMTMGLEANPKYKTVEAYDFGGRRQYVESPEQKEKRLEKKAQEQAQQQAQSGSPKVTPLSLNRRDDIPVKNSISM